MRKTTLLALCVCVLAAGCETTDGDGYLTHSDHRLSGSERAAVETKMRTYLKVPVSISGLQASYRLSDGAVAVCGYVSGQTGGTWTPPALFAGTLSGSVFTPFKAAGKGQDPKRIAAVRSFCLAEQISI